MAATRTLWFTLFGAIGLAASAASTWVHYRILADPTYASFCDVNSTWSCTEAYSSQYGAVAGVPVALLGVVFFGFVLGLVALSSRSASARENLPGYIFAASTIGLAAVLYLAYASYFILNVICMLCVGTYVAVIGLFLVSGSAARYPMTSLPSRAAADLRTLTRTPAALAAAVAFVAASAAAIAWFPEQRVAAAAGAAGAAEAGAESPAPASVPTASASQIEQFEQFLAAQPRLPVAADGEGAAVVIVKFNDYQCPACGQTYRDHKSVVAKWEAQAPGQVKFISKDYPLERECNQFMNNDMHPGACEAAVAVRLAREQGRATAMEDWLFANQPALNATSVKNAAITVGGVTDFDARYEAMLALVRADIAQGQQLKITGTPTFFMNGIRLPGLRAEFFDAAIAWELKRVTGGQ